MKKSGFTLPAFLLTTAIFSSFLTLNAPTASAGPKSKKPVHTLKKPAVKSADANGEAESDNTPPVDSTPGYGGGFTPGFGGGYPSGPYAWCNQALKKLQNAEAYANMEYTYARFDSALKYLFEGLQQAAAMEGQYRQNRPLVAWAIQRGIKLSANLIQALNGSLNQKRTASLFLSNYYKFIFELVSDVDAPYWVPAFQGSCFGSIGGCGFDVAAFEQEFIDYVQDEMRLPLDSLATEMPNGFIVPIGTGRAFLTTLRDSVEFAAADLMSSPFATQYACAITTLYQTYQHLTQVLSGPLGGGREIQEVNYNYRLVSQVVDGLSRDYESCKPCSWKPRRFR